MRTPGRGGLPSCNCWSMLIRFKSLASLPTSGGGVGRVILVGRRDPIGNPWQLMVRHPSYWDNSLEKQINNYLHKTKLMGFLDIFKDIKPKPEQPSNKESEIKLNIPKKEEDHYEKGLSFYKIGEYQKAIQEYDLAISSSFWFPVSALEKKGDTSLKLENYEQALQLYNKILMQEESNIAVSLNLERSTYFDSYSEFNNPNNVCSLEEVVQTIIARVSRKRGISLENLGNYQEAIKAYEKAASLDISDKLNILDDLTRTRNKLKERKKSSAVVNISGEKVHIGDNKTIIRDSVLTRSNISIEDSIDDSLCPECGVEVPQNQKFCGNCGARIR